MVSTGCKVVRHLFGHFSGFEVFRIGFDRRDLLLFFSCLLKTVLLIMIIKSCFVRRWMLSSLIATVDDQAGNVEVCFCFSQQLP